MPTAFVTGGSGFLGRNLIAYLRERGWAVRALGRSEAALAQVRAQGAEGVAGDLTIGPAVAAALGGCDVVFHSAAWADDWGDATVAWDANVGGTQRLLSAARAAGVPRLVHVSTEAVLVGGRPIVGADETWEIPRRPMGLYASTKAEAEKRVRAASAPGFAAIVVRPRFIWGKGDTTLLPRFIEAVKTGAMQWIGGGRYLTSTTHVRNVCEGLLRAAEKGKPGEVYFVTDGAPVVFRDMVEKMLATQGVTVPDRSLPRWLAHGVAITTDAAWRWLRLRGRPPLPHASFHLIGEEVTVRDDKARREIGYQGEMTIERGLAEMAAAAAPGGAS
jgi:nucleoside-diphosphate-sugar epimerase